jgi:gamma-glutamylcyclotransferase
MNLDAERCGTEAEEGKEKMNGDQWYFAYGSNLLVDQKEKRTGRIRQAVRSRLKGYRFAFNKRGGSGQIYANIAPDDTAEVWGIVYLCNPEAIRRMDQCEGVASGHYERIRVTVETDTGEKVDAITYVAGEDFICEPGKPSDQYLGTIISGARHHALPEEYVRTIEALAE